MIHDSKKGFTLIELMLSMTFIAALLLAIAMTTIQISVIYTTGITLREVDQAGTAISSDLQSEIEATSPFDVTPKVDNSPATALSKYVVRSGGGRLCLGQYTYVWNYGSAINGTGPPVFNTYDDGTVVRFAKVLDPSGALCTDPTVAPKKADSIDLLTTGDRDLVLQSFNIIKTANDTTTGQAIYAISMVIGTNDEQDLNATNTACQPPSTGDGNEAYCAVDEFDIIARAGNQTGGQ